MPEESPGDGQMGEYICPNGDSVYCESLWMSCVCVPLAIV